MQTNDRTYPAGPIEVFEAEVAALLRKEAAEQRDERKAVQLAAHPRSHIVEDENDAIGALLAARDWARDEHGIVLFEALSKTPHHASGRLKWSWTATGSRSILRSFARRSRCCSAVSPPIAR